MKSVLCLFTSLILILSAQAFATNTDTEAPSNEPSSKQPTIKELLAEKQFVQGDVARGIDTYRIDSWRYLDKHHIYIDGVGRNNNYLVEFSNQCRDTRGSESIFYKTRTGELTKFDTIGVINSLSGHHSSFPSRSCFIKEIYHLERIEETADEETEPATAVIKT